MNYLTESTYGVWGIIMAVVLLGLVCYNAWQDDADDRRKGYYVLACALVLGVLILLGLHIWQVDPADIVRTHRDHAAFLCPPDDALTEHRVNQVGKECHNIKPHHTFSAPPSRSPGMGRI